MNELQYPNLAKFIKDKKINGTKTAAATPEKDLNPVKIQELTVKMLKDFGYIK